MLGLKGRLVAMTKREQARRDRLATDAARALLGLVAHAGTRAAAPDAVSRADVKRHAATLGRALQAIAETAAADAVRVSRQRGADAIDAEVEATIHAAKLVAAIVGETYPDAVLMAETCGRDIRRSLEAVN